MGEPSSSSRSSRPPDAAGAKRVRGRAGAAAPDAGKNPEHTIATRNADEDALRAVAASHTLTEDLALMLLERRDLPRLVLEDLAKNGRAMKSRKVKNAVALHVRTPRHVSLPLIRHLYTFELMKVVLTPHVATQVKLAAEDSIVNRMETISSGERLTLAKRCSSRVATALLNDGDIRIIDAALDNPFLTEIGIVKALLREKASQLLPIQVSKHGKWSQRKDVRAALLRNPCTPLAHAISFSQLFTLRELEELLDQSKQSEKVKAYLLEMARKRRR